MHRVQRHHRVRRMSIRWCELKLKPLKDHAHRHPGLKECEVLADAYARSPTKWEERARVLGRLGNPLGEPLRLEIVNVSSPYVRIMVDKQNRDLDERIGWVRDISNLHLLVGSPTERGGRRV